MFIFASEISNVILTEYRLRFGYEAGGGKDSFCPI